MPVAEADPADAFFSETAVESSKPSLSHRDWEAGGLGIIVGRIAPLNLRSQEEPVHGSIDRLSAAGNLRSIRPK